MALRRLACKGTLPGLARLPATAHIDKEGARWPGGSRPSQRQKQQVTPEPRGAVQVRRAGGRLGPLEHGGVGGAGARPVTSRGHTWSRACHQRNL